MITRTVDIPIYRGELVIHWCEDLSTVQEKYATIPLDNFGAVTLRLDHRQYMVAFEGGIDLGLIAHEAVHLVNLIFTDTGVILDPRNDEAQAYLTAWVFDTIYETIK